MTAHHPLCQWANTPTHRDRANCPECARIHSDEQGKAEGGPRYGYASEGRAIPTCLRCGALVTNQPLHDKHHENIDAMTQLSVTTAHNLMSTLNALVGEVPE
jgi:hypothetical protein